MTTFIEVDVPNALTIYAYQQNPNVDLSDDNCWTLPDGRRTGFAFSDIVWTHATIPAPTENGLIAIHDAFVASNQALAIETATLTAAQNVALNQAKTYLRKQLLNASPDMSVIFTTVKGYVDGNAALLQMVNNQIDLNRSAFSWPALNLVTPAAVDRTRYLRCIEDVVSLIG